MGQIFLRIRLFFLMHQCFLLIRHSSRAITIGHECLDCQEQKKKENVQKHFMTCLQISKGVKVTDDRGCRTCNGS